MRSLGHPLRYVAHLLMPRENKAEVIAVVDGVKDGQDGAPGIAKDLRHFALPEDLMDNLRTGHAHKLLVSATVGR